jgi:hypothetical protein
MSAPGVIIRHARNGISLTLAGAMLEIASECPPEQKRGHYLDLLDTLLRDLDRMRDAVVSSRSGDNAG